MTLKMSCYLNSLFQKHITIFILLSSIELIVNHFNFLANCPYFRKFYLSTVHFCHIQIQKPMYFILLFHFERNVLPIFPSICNCSNTLSPLLSYFQMYLPFDQFQKHLLWNYFYQFIFILISSGILSENCIEILCSLQY